jgi:Domain of unknown function (DUF6378)
MTDTAEKIVADREVIYGDFNRQAKTAQAIKKVLVASPNWRDLSEARKEALDLIATKTSRILHGDPDHEDSWDDIGGYAHLGKNGKD